nr:hypothetical protein BaRGS_005770 [Batillaria attramentaria]
MFDMTKEGESAVKNKTKELCLLDNFDGRTVNGKTRFREDPMEFGLLEVEENGYNVLFIDKAVPMTGKWSLPHRIIVDAPLKIQDEGRITDRQIEDLKKYQLQDEEWSMTVEIPKQKKGAGKLIYKGVKVSRGDTFGRRQINAAHRDRLM